MDNVQYQEDQAGAGTVALEDDYQEEGYGDYYDDGSGQIDPNTGMPYAGADGNKGRRYDTEYFDYCQVYSNFWNLICINMQFWNFSYLGSHVWLSFDLRVKPFLVHVFQHFSLQSSSKVIPSSQAPVISVLLCFEFNDFVCIAVDELLLVDS